MVRLVISLLTFLCKVVRALGLSVGNYQATLTIEGFKGVMQFDENESINTDMKYAADARNFDTRDGNLLPLMKPQSAVAVPSTALISNIWEVRTGLSWFGNRFVYVTTDPRAYFTRQDSWEIEGYVPIGGYTGLWAGVQYERTIDDEVVPVFYLTNSADGMREISASPGQDDRLVLISRSVSTPHNFSMLALYGERLWGAVNGDNNETICYSAPYMPWSWDPDDNVPEDGGGEIRIADFDGDRITAIYPFGSSLLIFKEHHLYRLTGLSPDEFTIQEQYGGGTIYSGSIAVYQERVFFLTSNGMCVYDGVSVRPFQQYALRTLWRNEKVIPGVDSEGKFRDTTRAVVHKDRYYLSFPGSGTGGNFTVMYDFNEGAWSYMDAGLDGDGINPELYLIHDNDLYVLQLEGPPATYPISRWYKSIEDVPDSEVGSSESFIGFDWLTPWSDMGAKDILKNEFKLRFWIQTHMASGDKLKLAVTVETERGSKTREIIFDRDVDEENKMRFHLSGRKVRMRFKLTDKDGNEQITSWCKIMGGMQLNADTSPD